MREEWEGGKRGVVYFQLSMESVWTEYLDIFKWSRRMINSEKKEGLRAGRSLTGGEK